MTSDANDVDTRAFFEQNDFFGFDASDVMFFRQAMVPSMDFDGKLILAQRNRLAMNPDGHGGSLAALARSGALDDMTRRGVDTVSYFQVDNPLVTICDPVFVGYHLDANADMSSKVLEKCEPEEKVGVVCYIDGTLGVVEYSDLDEKNMHARDENGRLRFWAGSIAIHMVSVSFVERIAGDAGLPWHVAVKKIPHVDESGLAVSPDEPNGVKFETFVFDALPLTKASVNMEVRREDEFAPVKNPTGTDSVESCRRLMSDYAARILADAGVDVPLDADGHVSVPVELSYLRALDAAEAKERVPENVDFETSVTLGPVE